MSDSGGPRGCSWAPNVHNMTPGVSGDLVVRYGARFVAVTMVNVSIEHRRISMSHTRLRVHLTTHGKATRRVLWAARTICELPKQVWTIGGGLGKHFGAQHAPQSHYNGGQKGASRELKSAQWGCTL